MELKFGGKSGLCGIVIRQKFERFSFVPQPGSAHMYVLTFTKIPTSLEEPDLYRNSYIARMSEDEVELCWEGLSERVILMTTKADDKYRAESDGAVEGAELFVLNTYNLIDITSPSSLSEGS